MWNLPNKNKKSDLHRDGIFLDPRVAVAPLPLLDLKMHRESGWRSDFHIFKCLRVSWPPCALPVSNTRTCTVFREPLREASSAFENEGKLNEGKRCAANWKIVVKIAFWKCERSYWCLDSNNAPDITEENKIKESFRHRGWITIEIMANHHRAWVHNHNHNHRAWTALSPLVLVLLTASEYRPVLILAQFWACKKNFLHYSLFFIAQYYPVLPSYEPGK